MLQPEPVRLPTEGQKLMNTVRQELGQSEAEEGNPFNYTPLLIHLHKDHELFEVT